MNNSRFDAVSRWVGQQPSSRRVIVRALAALGLGLGSVVPSKAPVAANPRGKPHRRTCRGLGRLCGAGHGSCCSFGGARTCGTVAKGYCPQPLRNPRTERLCCVRDGAGCTTSCECCGASVCRNGVCGEPCTEQGQTCTSGQACCGQAEGTHACAVVNPFKGRFGCGPAMTATQPQCCRRLGVGCAETCECCGSLECLNGVCGCRSLGQKCTDGSQCCPDAAGVSCAVVAPKQTPNPGEVCLLPGNDPDPRYCCVGVGKRCGTSCQCCGGLVCRDGSCQDVSCVLYGQSCRLSGDCCSGVPCNGGRCVYP